MLQEDYIQRGYVTFRLLVNMSFENDKHLFLRVQCEISIIFEVLVF